MPLPPTGPSTHATTQARSRLGSPAPPSSTSQCPHLRGVPGGLTDPSNLKTGVPGGKTHKFMYQLPAGKRGGVQLRMTGAAPPGFN